MMALLPKATPSTSRVVLGPCSHGPRTIRRPGTSYLVRPRQVSLTPRPSPSYHPLMTIMGTFTRWKFRVKSLRCHHAFSSSWVVHFFHRSFLGVPSTFSAKEERGRMSIMGAQSTVSDM